MRADGLQKDVRKRVKYQPVLYVCRKYDKEH